MGLLETQWLKRILRRGTWSLRCRVVILLYHRVFETSSDPWALSVSPKHFAEHLEHLRRHHILLSLPSLLNHLRESRLPERGVVLTFDDGYADNLWNAKLLLEKYEVPATIFVASGSVDSPGEFWWDELERALLQPKKVPNLLKLLVHGRSYNWPTVNSEERWHAYMAIHKILQPLSASDRDRLMTELFDWAGVEQTGRADYRPLTTAELIQLAESEFVEIGAHTVTHPLLSAISQADQSAEIVNCRQELADILGNRVDAFSYPYGNFTAETVKIVKAAGFEIALTTVPKAAEAWSNRFQIGRFGVGDWKGEKFKQHLDEFFRA